MRFILLFLIGVILFPLNVNAAPAPLILHYEIYAGGIHALSADMGIDRQVKTYHLLLTAKPYGVIGNLLPWGGKYETKGNIVSKAFIPTTFNKTSQWREDNDSDAFVYKNGVLMSQIETDETKKPPVIKTVMLDPALTANAIDILTGTVQLLQQLDAGKSCDFSTVVYDGRRRYTLKFTDKGSENLMASQYNSFSGAAKLCEIEMIPIAGFSKKLKGYYKIQEDARKYGQLPRVWLGQVSGYYVPVKMLVKSEYGAVLVHLQKK